MTQIDFYSGVADKLAVVCQLAQKALAKGNRVLVFAPDGDTLRRLDSLLWTTPALGFIPHCTPDHRCAAETPVILCNEAHEFNHYDVLINLQSTWSPFFSRFARLLEIVSPDEADRAAARVRWRFYKDRGYQISNIDLGR